MQIKKFVAPTLKDATIQMKAELGDEAIILGSRMIMGDNSTGKRKMFEITAGVDNINVKSNRHEKTSSNRKREERNFEDELALLKEKIYSKQRSMNSFSRPSKSYEPGIDELLQEPDDFSLDTELDEIADVLNYREVNKTIINNVVKQLKGYNKLLKPDNLDSYVISSISSMIPTGNFELMKGKKAQVVSLVGPTGVGKTTCIAKLAVIAKILNNIKVGLISIDTYRLGAIDQLKIFSDISNIEMLVAYEPEDMPGLVNKFKDKDLIFIDTAGRSQKDRAHLETTKKFLDKIPVDKTFLVLSSTHTTRTLQDAVEKFGIFNFNSLIFTKIDEAAVFGNLLNVVTNYNYPVIFLSNGQVIPDDIVAAEPEFIAKMIYSGKAAK